MSWPDAIVVNGAGDRFMAGEPMKPATKIEAGLR